MSPMIPSSPKVEIPEKHIPKPPETSESNSFDSALRIFGPSLTGEGEVRVQRFRCAQRWGSTGTPVVRIDALRHGQLRVTQSGANRSWVWSTSSLNVSAPRAFRRGVPLSKHGWRSAWASVTELGCRCCFAVVAGGLSVQNPSSKVKCF